MKIECPSCKLTGNIDDSRVPATGLNMNCPRCKSHFTVERPVQETGAVAAMQDTCPSCGYATFSEEKFAVCPKCGLVIAEHHQKLLAARGAPRSRASSSSASQQEQALPAEELSAGQRAKEEEARKKYGLDSEAAEAGEKEPLNLRRVFDAPLPVQIIGGITVVVALALIIYGISGYLEYQNKLKEASAALLAGDAADSGATLLLQFGLFPMLTAIYAFVMLVFGSMFLTLKGWSIKALNFGALFGMGLFALMEIADMVTWCRRASSDASFGYYATGIGSGILMAALWILPLIALSEYLQSSQFERVSKQFD